VGDVAVGVVDEEAAWRPRTGVGESGVFLDPPETAGDEVWWWEEEEEVPEAREMDELERVRACAERAVVPLWVVVLVRFADEGEAVMVMAGEVARATDAAVRVGEEGVLEEAWAYEILAVVELLLVAEALVVGVVVALREVAERCAGVVEDVVADVLVVVDEEVPGPEKFEAMAEMVGEMVVGERITRVRLALVDEGEMFGEYGAADAA